ncbi:MAG: hypothetical protein M3Z03_01165 [Actinomycetota bacterium]|nr:hypothetical protein [Actinomycetota bacterium]
MSTTEIAAVVVAGAAVVGVVIMAVLFARLTRTVRDVGQSVQMLRFEQPVIPAQGQLAATSDGPTRKVAKDPATLVAKVARANPVVDVSDPVIKIIALASGTSRAASRFRRSRTDRS